MAYQGMRDGARMVLMCLEPGEALSVTAARQKVLRVYQHDDPRTVFHLENLAYIGLAQKVALPGEQVGYQLTEIGLRESNQIAVNKKKSN